MASGAKSFVLNRKSDWQSESIIKNIKFKNDMAISDIKNGENGVYISRAFDSLENGTAWHRFRANIECIRQNGRGQYQELMLFRLVT